MPIKATEIADALVAQMAANGDIAAEFTGKIGKGFGKNFNFNVDGQGIRVYLVSNDPDYINVTNQTEIVWYSFFIIVLFSDNDDVSAEDRKAKYDSWVRAAVKSDLSLGGKALNVEFGPTRYKEDPKSDVFHYILIQASVQSYEQ